MIDRIWLGTSNFKWSQKGIPGFKRDWLMACKFMYTEYYDPKHASYKFKNRPLYSKWNRCNTFIPKEYYNKRYRQFNR